MEEKERERERERDRQEKRGGIVCKYDLMGERVLSGRV